MNTRLLLGLHAIPLVLLVFIAFVTNGVGDEGDSLTHFFIAQQSWSNYDFFFHHWGKPFFTLFASPWAQFGFTGIKIFNIICGVAASFVTCLLAKELGKPRAWIILLIAFIAPAFYTHLFSGLTEPFSALVTVTAVWLVFTNRVSWGFILASFLPFCRSEAQLYLFFFALYGLLNGHWKKIPFLATGYILYSLIGGLYLGNFMWVFDIPYKPDNDFYGSGGWLHFPEQLTFMIGGIQIVLLVLGVFQMFRNLYFKKISWKKEPVLIQSLFFSLMLAHMVVWKLGVYGSAGLPRVLALGFPFMWLTILDGVNLTAELSSKWFAKKVWILPTLLMAFHLLTILNQPATFKYYKNRVLLSEQRKIVKEEISPYIKQNHPDSNYFVFEDPYIATALDINFMSWDNRTDWRAGNNLDQLPKNSILWWDHGWAQMQYGITTDQIEATGQFELLGTWQGETWIYKIYKKVK